MCAAPLVSSSLQSTRRASSNRCARAREQSRPRVAGVRARRVGAARCCALLASMAPPRLGGGAARGLNVGGCSGATCRVGRAVGAQTRVAGPARAHMRPRSTAAWWGAGINRDARDGAEHASSTAWGTCCVEARPVQRAPMLGCCGAMGAPNAQGMEPQTALERAGPNCCARVGARGNGGGSGARWGARAAANAAAGGTHTAPMCGVEARACGWLLYKGGRRCWWYTRGPQTKETTCDVQAIGAELSVR